MKSVDFLVPTVDSSGRQHFCEFKRFTIARWRWINNGKITWEFYWALVCHIWHYSRRQPIFCSRQSHARFDADVLMNEYFIKNDAGCDKPFAYWAPQADYSFVLHFRNSRVHRWSLSNLYVFYFSVSLSLRWHLPNKFHAEYLIENIENHICWLFWERQMRVHCVGDAHFAMFIHLKFYSLLWFNQFQSQFQYNDFFTATIIVNFNNTMSNQMC